MKDLFPGYYPYNYSQIQKFLKDSTIVFGASVLLDLFRISHGRTFLNIIERKISKERLWLPYDTVWLYHNRLVSVIEEQVENDISASMHLTAFKEAIHNEHSHPFISLDLMEKFDSFISEIESSLESDRRFLLKCLGRHDMKLKISELFHGRIGTEYDKIQTKQVYDESQKRNADQLPPCMTFSASPELRIKHNRYVIWKQIQQYAKENNRPILMVLNRITPNWFFTYKDSIVLPHQYLINEFKQETGQEISIISAHYFLDHLLNAGEKDDEVIKLLNQLHNKPTLGNNQQIAPFMPNSNSI